MTPYWLREQIHEADNLGAHLGADCENEVACYTFLLVRTLELRYWGKEETNSIELQIMVGCLAVDKQFGMWWTHAFCSVLRCDRVMCFGMWWTHALLSRVALRPGDVC